MRFWSLGGKHPLEKGMTTHCSFLAWRIPWTEEPDRLQSIGSQRIGYDWAAEHSCVHAVPRYRTSLPTPAGEDQQRSLSPWEAVVLLYFKYMRKCKNLYKWNRFVHSSFFRGKNGQCRLSSSPTLFPSTFVCLPYNCVTAPPLPPHTALSRLTSLCHSFCYCLHFVFSLTTELLKLLLNVLKGTVYWKAFLTTT